MNETCHICTHDQSTNHNSNSRDDKIMKSQPKNNRQTHEHVAKNWELIGCVFNFI